MAEVGDRRWRRDARRPCRAGRDLRVGGVSIPLNNVSGRALRRLGSDHPLLVMLKRRIRSGAAANRDQLEPFGPLVRFLELTLADRDLGRIARELDARIDRDAGALEDSAEQDVDEQLRDLLELEHACQRDNAGPGRIGAPPSPTAGPVLVDELVAAPGAPSHRAVALL